MNIAAIGGVHSDLISVSHNDNNHESESKVGAAKLSRAFYAESEFNGVSEFWQGFCIPQPSPSCLSYS